MLENKDQIENLAANLIISRDNRDEQCLLLALKKKEPKLCKLLLVFTRR